MNNKTERERKKWPRLLTSRSLPEGSRSFFFVDLEEGVDDALVLRLALALSHLDSRLDHVGGRAQTGRRHAGNEARVEQAHRTVVALVVGEHFLRVGVGWKVDHAERDVAQQARTNSLFIRFDL